MSRPLPLAVLSIFGCSGVADPPAAIELPPPSVDLPEPPASVAAGGVVPPLLPAGNRWSLDFEYAASQRGAGLPDLDVVASGTARVVVAPDDRLAVDVASVTTRPAGPAMELAVEAAVEGLVRRLREGPWRVAGAVADGTLLVTDGVGTRGWAIADPRGFGRAHARFERADRRDGAAQRSRLTVALTRDVER